MLELATSCLSPHRPNGAIAAKLTIALGGRIRGSSCGVEVSSEAVTTATTQHAKYSRCNDPLR